MRDDEMVAVVDERGGVLREVRKTEAHRFGWLHKTVIGCLRYGDDFALVQQAADRQDAGQWVNPVGGHVRAGEANEAALLRECEEEIGTKNVTFTFLGSAPYHRQVIGRDENHLFYVYEIRTDDEIVLGPEAVALLRFTAEELRRLCAKNSPMLGDAYYFVAEKWYPELLPPGYEPRFSNR